MRKLNSMSLDWTHHIIHYFTSKVQKIQIHFHWNDLLTLLIRNWKEKQYLFSQFPSIVWSTHNICRVFFSTTARHPFKNITLVILFVNIFEIRNEQNYVCQEVDQPKINKMNLKYETTIAEICESICWT